MLPVCDHGLHRAGFKQHKQRARLQTDEAGDAFWNIECLSNKSYVILINNDPVGSTQRLECGVLEAFKAGDCFTKFKLFLLLIIYFINSKITAWLHVKKTPPVRH
jgi:hypothetical protein